MNALTSAIKNFMVFFYSIFLISLSSCSFSSESPNAISDSSAFIVKIGNDQLISKKSDRIASDKVFDSVSYIPLETNPKCMFSRIEQLEIIDDKFVILDRASKSLLVFNKEGRFLFKITSRSIYEFAIDYNKKTIVFQDYLDLKKYTYGLDGKLLQTVKNTFHYSNFAFLDNYIAHYRYFANSKINQKIAKDYSQYNLIITDSTNGIINGFFPYNSSIVAPNEVFSVSKAFYKNGINKTYFLHPYDYHVYDITSKTPLPVYKFEFEQNRILPLDFLSSSKYSGDRMDYLDDNSEIIYNISDFYEVNNVLFFRLKSKTWSNVFYFQKNTNKTFELFNISSGIENNFLPLGEDIHAADSNSVIRSVSSEHLFKAKWLFGDKFPQDKLSENLKTFFREGSTLNNPVLVREFVK